MLTKPEALIAADQPPRIDKCVVGRWVDNLDTDDTIAFDQAADTLSRVDLYKAINTVFGKLFGLTALKDHLLSRCCCD